MGSFRPDFSTSLPRRRRDHKYILCNKDLLLFASSFRGCISSLRTLLKKQFRLQGVRIHPRPRRNRPGPPRRFSYQFPTRCREAGPRFGFQDVGSDLFVSERESRPRRCTVEKRTGVLGPICAKPRHLQGQSIIPMPGNRPPHSHHPHNLVTQGRANAELVADHGLMVPVVRLNEGVGLIKRQGDGCQFHHPTSRPRSSRFASGFP